MYSGRIDRHADRASAPSRRFRRRCRPSGFADEKPDLDLHRRYKLSQPQPARWAESEWSWREGDIFPLVRCPAHTATSMSASPIAWPLCGCPCAGTHTTASVRAFQRCVVQAHRMYNTTHVTLCLKQKKIDFSPSFSQLLSEPRCARRNISVIDGQVWNTSRSDRGACRRRTPRTHVD